MALPCSQGVIKREDPIKRGERADKLNLKINWKEFSVI